MNSMRIVYFGTPDFAVPALDALVMQSGHEVLAVVSQPDRPKGRNRRLMHTPVSVCARQHGLSLLQPEKADKDFSADLLQKYQPEVVIVAAFGQKLPQNLLEIPRLGCVNLHASLLPKYRGPAPIHHAILNGDTQSGITYMHISEKIDTGDILEQHAVAIGDQENTGELFARLAALGAEKLCPFLERLQTNKIQPMPQDERQASYAKKIKKEDGWVDWCRSATDLACHVRGMTPWPGARTVFSGMVIQILQARLLDQEGKPGQVLDILKQGILVGCGKGCLMLETLKPEGKNVMSAWDFANGRCIQRGDCFGKQDA